MYSSQYRELLSRKLLCNSYIIIVPGTLSIQSIKITDIGIYTITVSWTIPDYDPNNVCGPVMYRVTISGPDINDTDTTDTIMYTFTGLTPNTNYTITITPYNSAGEGTPEIEVVMTMMPTGEIVVFICILFVAEEVVAQRSDHNSIISHCLKKLKGISLKFSRANLLCC